MKHFIYSFLFISFIIYCFSCSNKDSNKKYHIQLKLEKGTKYYFSSTTESITTIVVKEKKIEMNNKTETGFIHELLNDSAGFKHLKITYDVFKATIKKDGQVQELDISNTANINPVDKYLSKLKGKSLNIYLDNKGKILEIKGYKELTDSLLTSFQIDDIYAKQTLQKQISELIGDNFIKNNLEQGFVIYPDSIIKIGDKWENHTTQFAQINFILNSKFLFENVKDNFAYLTSNAEIQTDSSTLNIMSMNVNSNLKGNQDASYKIDLNSGLINEGISNTNIKGNIQVMGTEVPITIKISATSSTKKI